MQANDENLLLNDKKLPEILVTDNHLVHIDIHSKANQNAWSIAHIQAHKKFMLIKRDRPDLFPPTTQGLQIKPEANTNVGPSIVKKPTIAPALAQ